MGQHNHRNLTDSARPGRAQASFTSDDAAVRPDENWVYKAEFPDAGADLRYLLTGVRTRVTVVREKPIHGPTLDLDIQIPHSADRKSATGPAARSSRLRLQVVD